MSFDTELAPTATDPTATNPTATNEPATNQPAIAPTSDTDVTTLIAMLKAQSTRMDMLMASIVTSPVPPTAKSTGDALRKSVAGNNATTVKWLTMAESQNASGRKSELQWLAKDSRAYLSVSAIAPKLATLLVSIKAQCYAGLMPLGRPTDMAQHGIALRGSSTAFIWAAGDNGTLLVSHVYVAECDVQEVYAMTRNAMNVVVSPVVVSPVVVSPVVVSPVINAINRIRKG